LVLAGLAAILAAAKRFYRAGAGLALALANLAVIAPLYRSGPPATEVPAKYRAVLVNVHTQSNEFERMVEFIRAERPDFVAVLEVDQRWMGAVRRLRDKYPYSIEAPREDNFGIVFLSSLPIASGRVHDSAGFGLPTTVAELNLDGATVTVIASHPVPPANPMYLESRNQHLLDLARLSISSRYPVILLGDLNTTSWSPIFSELLREGRIQDSRRGFGIQPSWPVQQPYLLIPLDHCLVSPSITIINRRTGPDIGSDHYPVTVDLGINQQPVDLRKSL
jgi:endonuclease/exonuclease/phosphatase (EEP) superfamily protein YafD